MDLKSVFQAYLNLMVKIIPKPKSDPVLGIDIGTSSIKAIEIAQVAGGYEVQRWAIEPIDGGDAKAALGRLVKRLQASGSVPVCAVSGKGTLIRYIDLPRMPLEDLRKAFVYDLDKYFPFDPQSIYTDCCILDPQGKDKKMSVLVSAVKKEVIDERLKLFKEAGLELGQISINAIATTNAFNALSMQGTGSEAKAILDIGGAVSSLVVVKDNSPRFTRDIFIGSHELTRQIANSLGLDDRQAEVLKTAPGDQLSQVMDACEGPINNLIEEIRLSIDYFMTEKNIQVDMLFLVGGGSSLKGIETLFEKHFGMPVKIWDPLSGLRLSPSVASSDIQQYAPQLGVALGLGLTDL